MTDKTTDGNLADEGVAQAQYGSEDGKFRAASNVDRDADGKIVNGPFQDAAKYDETASKVAKEREVFVGDDPGTDLGPADRIDDDSLIAPGVAQPMGPGAGRISYIGDRDEIAQGGERPGRD